MNIVIKRAISIAGSQKELARKVGVDQSAVSKWLRGGGIRSQYIPSLVSATNGQLTAIEIINSLSAEATTEQPQP
ncbi:transcriptional regulator [Serratia marcescens]|uniref:Helix-turn-helix domain-containing protein n=1 Tax=Serratia marcescens TaxID=615 RepID=A0ABD6I0C9_SERMA|nr:YdaS family helix-turn-helix protein [Serratia marcescens]MVF02766.1 helix-turn-helix domain-containing protein [Serratia marcescens]QJU40998.1 helix-turn-helix domain-containing protein [Serratia marcescens]